MYKAISENVQVTVIPEFLPDQSDPDEERFFWAYTIEIVNLGPRTVQLMSRHWRITDGRGKVEEVRGPGVVGQQPVLKPGEHVEYTSGCVLETRRGAMHGTYQMQGPDGAMFDAEIAPFQLAMPHSLN